MIACRIRPLFWGLSTVCALYAQSAVASQTIDYTPGTYQAGNETIILYDAATIERINTPAPQAMLSNSTYTEPTTAEPVKEARIITPQPTIPPQSTPVVDIEPETSQSEANETSAFPVDLSPQYSRTVRGIPIIDSPQSCGNGQLEIKLSINDITKQKGVIVADLHNDVKEDFLDSSKVVLRIIQPVTQGSSTQTCIPIPKPGQYAVAIYHDRNKNQKFDKNLLGIPSEPFGMSNNPRFGMKAPEFEEAVFDVPETGTAISISLKKASDILKRQRK